MLTRRRLLREATASLAGVSIASTRALAGATPGVTDTSIKVGQTMVYSGAASAYGVFGRAEAAYFRMVNESGGINGRRIEFVSLDDGYSPPKAVEQTRRLVEQENVAFIFGSTGTPSNSAIRGYLNEHAIPQLFIFTGASKWGDAAHYPWTMGFQPNYQTEAHIYAEHILRTTPQAKLGLLYQNDDFGKDYLIGLKARLGDEHGGMLVKALSYEVSDPTIDSQVTSLQGSGADTFVIAATAKSAAQAIRRSYDIGWKATRYLSNVSISIGSVMRPAGLQKGTGIISAGFVKDPTDPRWQDDPGYRRWLAFMQKYIPAGDLKDGLYGWGYNGAQALVEVLKLCGNDLSRANIMRQAQGLRNVPLDMLLPGITLNGRPDNTSPIRQLQLHRFDGRSWRPFGDVMAG